MSAVRGSKRMMAGLSGAVVEDIPDARAVQVHDLGVVARSVAEERIARIFTGTNLATDETKIALIVEAVQLATDAFNKIAENYILICNSLYYLSTRLTPREFATIRQNAASLFPFSRAQASMFRKIGEAITGTHPRLDAQHAPRDWTTAYQLATLSDDEFAIAKERGLVRRDVVRREVEEFRRQIRPSRMTVVETALAMPRDADATVPSMSVIRREQRDNRAELEALTVEFQRTFTKLVELNRRRRDLRSLLASPGE